MRRFLSHAVIYSALISIAACHSSRGSGEDAGLASFNKDSLVAAIRVLSSDSFQGRRPFTAGETRTIDYLVNSCQALGLEPGSGNSYTQKVPLVEISPAAPSSLELMSPICGN